MLRSEEPSMPMAPRTANKWVQLRRGVLEEVTRLTAITGNKLPSDLARIAELQSVRKIEFRPLLVDGGLAVIHDGFHVFVSCEPNEAEHLNHLFGQDGTGRTLPKTLVKQARFTIAHEIAHTLLYDLKTTPPRSVI